MFHKAKNSQIADEAADWAISIDSGIMLPSEKEALADWLRESPQHVDELLIATSILAGLEDVDGQRRLSIDELLSSVSENGADNVVTLSNSPTPERTRSQPQRQTRNLGIAAATACLALALAFTYLGLNGLPGQDTNRVYITALGEQRSISLGDGSVIHVNTQSEIRVSYSDTERRIELLNGEAMFDVKKDPHRPFRVMANNAIAEAIGTRFNVRYRDNDVSVVVLEGIVAVKTEDFADTGIDDAVTVPEPGDLSLADDGEVLLASGEKVNITPHTEKPVVATADITATQSWRLRQLVFESETLGTIVNEFNRYNKVQIVVMDDVVAQHEFSGLFQADDPWSFVAFLELTGNVAIASSPDEITLTSPAAQSTPGN